MNVFASSSVDETVESAHPGAESRSMGAFNEGRLVSVFPRGLQIELDLGLGPVVLGRAPDDGWTPPLPDRTASRAHFAIEWSSEIGTHIGRDLGSRNGSWVNGQRLEQGWHPLSPGTVVRIGEILLVYERGHLLSTPDGAGVSHDAIPGRSSAVRRLRNHVARAAPDISPALVLGETGTGKEKVAQEIHRLSDRPGPFVAVNCATLGDQLIDSELFGHRKGAFTGATRDQEGLFRAAEGGSLFLDEIGEMPLALQPKLLRAIQEGEVRAVGSAERESVDVRIIAATQHDLGEASLAGTFRRDLYARLALWLVPVPALTERRSDILVWLDHLGLLWRKDRNLPNAPPLNVDVEVAELLVRADWPENLRGLSRLVHELATSHPQDVLRRCHLPDWVCADSDAPRETV